MTDTEIKETFRTILEMLKQQVIYSHRLHGWLISMSETIEKDPLLSEHLKQHPLHDQGPERRIQSIAMLTQNIELLLQQFR